MNVLLYFILMSSVMFGKELSIINTDIIKTSSKIEPSGVVFNKKSKSVFIVSDNGYICEIKGSGEEICRRDKKRDLEGITIKDNGELIAIEEGKDNILYLNKDLSVNKNFSVDREFNGKLVLNKDGDGLESIAFHKSQGNLDFFFVANQSKKFDGDDKSAIFYISVDRNSFFNKNASIISYFPSSIKDISDMTFHNNSLYVLSDKENKLYIYSFFNDKLILENVFDIPGNDQEGIFIFDNKIYIAQDSGDIIVLTIGAKKSTY